MAMITSWWRSLTAPGMLAASASASASASAPSADYPAPRHGEWVLRDFRFANGQTLPELKLAYSAVGEPSGEPVLVLHGTTGSAASMLNPAFAGELFGPGQPLDAQRYFVILPDALGAGRSSKPSDGLRSAFPHYSYDDMVVAQHRLVTEHLGVQHLRLVLGNSMGGMHTWLWAQNYPGMLDIAVPMACLPAPMSGRNWMLRRMLIESIRNDPEWQGGHYQQQPRSLRFASVFFGLATNGGNQGLFKAAPTRAEADALLDQRLAAPFAGDANDHLYQWEASRDYDPAPGLARTRARVLAINSTDDERNPPELGLLEAALKRLPNARAYTIPSSPDTAGHATTGRAAFWKAELLRELQATPHAVR